MKAIFQMVSNLLSLRTSLAALHTMQTLRSGEYLKIVIDLVYIDTGLHNNNMIKGCETWFWRYACNEFCVYLKKCGPS